MTRWFRSFWDEESIWFYFELDTEGYVFRQVEIQEPSGDVLAAASLTEWQEAQNMSEYEKVYGLTAELPVSEWEGHNPQWLTADEFEAAWSAARQQIKTRQHERPA